MSSLLLFLVPVGCLIALFRYGLFARAVRVLRDAVGRLWVATLLVALMGAVVPAGQAAALSGTHECWAFVVLQGAANDRLEMVCEYDSARTGWSGYEGTNFATWAQIPAFRTGGVVYSDCGGIDDFDRTAYVGPHSGLDFGIPAGVVHFRSPSGNPACNGVYRAASATFPGTFGGSGSSTGHMFGCEYSGCSVGSDPPAANVAFQSGHTGDFYMTEWLGAFDTDEDVADFFAEFGFPGGGALPGEACEGMQFFFYEDDGEGWDLMTNPLHPTYTGSEENRYRLGVKFAQPSSGQETEQVDLFFAADSRYAIDGTRLNLGRYPNPQEVEDSARIWLFDVTAPLLALNQPEWSWEFMRVTCWSEHGQGNWGGTSDGPDDFGSTPWLGDPPEPPDEEVDDCFTFQGMKLTNPVTWVSGAGRMMVCLLRVLFVPDMDTISEAWSGLLETAEEVVPFAWIFEAHDLVTVALLGTASAVEASEGDCLQVLPDEMVGGTGSDAYSECADVPDELDTIRPLMGIAVWAFWGWSMFGVLFPRKAAGSSEPEQLTLF